MAKTFVPLVIAVVVVMLIGSFKVGQHSHRPRVVNTDLSDISINVVIVAQAQWPLSDDKLKQLFENIIDSGRQEVLLYCVSELCSWVRDGASHKDAAPVLIASLDCVRKNDVTFAALDLSLLHLLKSHDVSSRSRRTGGIFDRAHVLERVDSLSSMVNAYLVQKYNTDCGVDEALWSDVIIKSKL
jgi:hypothetical protein